MTLTDTQFRTATVLRSEVAERLKFFCRAELAAAETYARALSSDSLVPFSDVLQWCQQSHRERARALSDEIRRLGGDIPQSSGVWGALIQALEGAAAVLGPRAAIAVLEEREEQSLRDYRARYEKLDPVSQSFTRERILPAQMETHRALSCLKQSFAA